MPAKSRVVIIDSCSMSTCLSLKLLAISNQIVPKVPVIFRQFLPCQDRRVVSHSLATIEGIDQLSFQSDERLLYLRSEITCGAT